VKRDRCDNVVMIYLDHAATTPMRPEVWEAMAPFATEVFGNASGSHGESRRAKNALEEARERAAACLGCAPGEIVFTAGGTEADNLAIKGRALLDGPRPIVTTAIEHEAVLESAGFCERMGAEVRIVPVGADGRIDPDEVVAAAGDDAAVVSVMYANNELGVIQPIPQVAEALGGRAVLHTDAVQAFSSEDLDVARLGVDMLSLAAHKFGGPKGVGLLYVREGVALEPVLHGGGQELGRRSGTSNVMGAVGMATAMELAVEDRARFRADVGAARTAFEDEVLGSGAAVRTASLGPTLVQHSHLRFPGVLNETLLVRLDRGEVAASVGSACSSGAATPSHVLAAIGLDAAAARETLRFSFGWTTRPGDGAAAAARVLAALDRRPAGAAAGGRP
jgi:cysteine desulfurase